MTAISLFAFLPAILGLDRGAGEAAPAEGCPDRHHRTEERPGTADEAQASLTRRRFDSCPGQESLFAAFPGAAEAPLSLATPGYARLVFPLRWRAGETLSYGATFYLPGGFHAALDGQVALMRWDNHPDLGSMADVGGIVIYGSDRRARLVRGQQGGRPQVALTKPFDLPENSWFRLTVRQRRGEPGSRPLNEVFVNGDRVRRSHAASSVTGYDVRRARFGLVAMATTQMRPLALWFDRPAIAVSP